MKSSVLPCLEVKAWCWNWSYFLITLVCSRYSWILLAKDNYYNILFIFEALEIKLNGNNISVFVIG